VSKVQNKGNCKGERAVTGALINHLYSPLYVEIHKKTSKATKRQECEDIYIPLPEQELQQNRGTVYLMHLCYL
jgi:hypothetical protein